jgi:hypothetical protein
MLPTAPLSAGALMTLRHLGIAALFFLVIGIATQIPIPSVLMPPRQPSPAMPNPQNEPAAAAPAASAPPTPSAADSHREFYRNFDQMVAQRQEQVIREEAAIADHSIPADPKQHAMYQEVVDTAEQVEGFPCSAHNRHRLAEAIAVLGNFDRDNYGKLASATQMDRGHPIAIDDPLAEQAYFITRDAMLDGVVRRSVSGVYEAPDPNAPTSPKPYLTGDNARFLCEHPS